MFQTKKLAILATVAALAIPFAVGVRQAGAKDNPMVGGAAMYPGKDIVDNAVNSKDHTTLVAAVKAAGLVDTLKGTAPSPSSRRPTPPSARFPRGTVDTLLRPENKGSSPRSSPITVRRPHRRRHPRRADQGGKGRPP